MTNTLAYFASPSAMKKKFYTTDTCSNATTENCGNILNNTARGQAKKNFSGIINTNLCMNLINKP